MTLRYPLQWPVGRRRRPLDECRRGQFKQNGRHLTMDQAVRRLRDELTRIGVADFILSTSQGLRKDGWPRADRRPADWAVAVYFVLDGKPHCMPCDTYSRIEDNIAAVAAHIEATRAVERYGVASLSEMFAGFEALPPPTQARPWREVFELHREPKITRAMLDQQFKRLARERHPDRGGSDALMAELNHARDAARKELGDA
jgi:hypothetical protein